MTLLVTCQNDLLLACRECNSIRAYCIADAGIADGYKWLRDAGDNPSVPHSIDINNYRVGTINDTGYYHVVVAPVLNTAPWSAYTITSTGTYPYPATRYSVSKTLRLKVRLASFTHWAYISNTEICYYPGWEGAKSYWVTGNVVDGPLHVNGKLYIAGDPVFKGPVTVEDIIEYYDPPGVDNPTFTGGCWSSFERITLPDPDPLLKNISDSASASGLVIDGRDFTDPANPKIGLYRADPANPAVHHDTTIKFLADGTMDVTNTKDYTTTTNMPIPANGAIYVQNGEVDVYGELNGQVTIGCYQNIYNSGSIIYHDTSWANPNPASTAMLGLVSNANVIMVNDLIANDHEHGVGKNGEVEIDAYIVALGDVDPHNGSFFLEDMGSVPGVKGDLLQYGGTMTKW